MEKFQNRHKRNFGLKFFIVFCLGLPFLNGFFVHSQKIRPYDIEKQKEHAIAKGYDSTYRVNYFENIIIKSFVSTNTSRFQVNSFSGEELFDLEPLGEYFVGVSFDYKWIGLELSWTPKFFIDDFNEVTSDEASTLSTSLNFFYSDRWRQEFKYIYSKGFRNNSTESASAIVDFSDTILQLIQGSTFFIANPNFSFRAFYAQTERQLKSTGSLIPRLIYSYGITRPNLVFEDIERVFISKVESFDLMAQLGYMYTFVHNEKWYATLGLHAGIGYNYSTYSLNEREKEILNSTFLTLQTETALGYNAYRWFFGVSGNWRNFNNNNNNKDSNQINRDFAIFNIHLGYRFNDNKPTRKFFGWFEDNLGF